MMIDKKTLRKIFILIAGCIAFGWLLLDTARAKEVFTYVWRLIAPFATGAAIAFIFNVPMRAIENQLEGIRKPGIRRIFAMLLTVFAMVLIVMFVGELLVPQIRETALSLAARIPAFLESTAAKLMVLMEEHPELEEWAMETFNLQQLEQLDWSNILRNALNVVWDSMTSLMGGAVSVIGSVTASIVNMVISIVFAIYCLGGKETLARQGRRLVYALLSEKHGDELIRIMRLTNVTFSNFISGQCLEAVILGCLFAVAMAIFKMPYIPLVSVTIGVTALIPVVGAFVGCVVGAFFILVNDPLQAVGFVAMFLVIQQLENNLIYPRVVGSSIGLPGMWVLVAVTVGGELLGVAGMLVMIPLVSVFYALIREFTARRLQERQIPAEKLQAQPAVIKSRFQENRERKERIRIKKMREKLTKMYQEKKNEKKQ